MFDLALSCGHGRSDRALRRCRYGRDFGRSYFVFGTSYICTYRRSKPKQAATRLPTSPRLSPHTSPLTSHLPHLSPHNLTCSYRAIAAPSTVLCAGTNRPNAERHLACIELFGRQTAAESRPSLPCPFPRPGTMAADEPEAAPAEQQPTVRLPDPKHGQPPCSLLDTLTD